MVKSENINIIDRLIKLPNADFSIDDSESIVRVYTNDTLVMSIDIMNKKVCLGNVNPEHPLFADIANNIPKNRDLLVAMARIYAKGFRYGSSVNHPTEYC